MARGKEPNPPANVVKFPKTVAKVEKPVVDSAGSPRLTEISKGGWTSWEHMTADLAHSIASGDLDPNGMVVIVLDKNVGTLILRRDVTPLQMQALLQDYVEANSADE